MSFTFIQEKILGGNSFAALFFSADGMKVAGRIYRDITVCNLAIAFDIATMTLGETWYGVSSQADYPEGVWFPADGTRMYVASRGRGAVCEYNLATPFLPSSSTYSRRFVLGFDPYGLTFSPDGTKFYVRDSSWNLRQYNMSSAGDVTSASLAHTFTYNEGWAEQPIDFRFNSTGAALYVLTWGAVGVRELTLATAYDLSTAAKGDVVWDAATHDPDVEFLEEGLFITPNEQNLFISGYLDGTGTVIRQYLGEAPSASEFWGYFSGQSEYV